MVDLTLGGGVSDVYDLVVVGASEGGVVASIRGAREGLHVLLVDHEIPLGGVFPSLGAIETHYGGKRAPLLEEIRSSIREHYRTAYGEESPQYRTCIARAPMTMFEPRVASAILGSMVERETNLEYLSGALLVDAETSDGMIGRIGVRTEETTDDAPVRWITGGTYLDTTYTGDLAAAVGVPYRIGRESRADFGEPHAGRLFTRWVQGKFPLDAAEGRLNLLAKATTLGLYGGSSGEGDDNVMAYSYRICLTNDPENRIDPPVPASYDRRAYLGVVESPLVTEKKRYALHHRFLTKDLDEMVADDHLFHGHELPNGKRSWNATNFPGEGARYAESAGPDRAAIERKHMDHALGLLHFLQSDRDVPEHIRRAAGEYGLAADEFEASGHLPPQLYVREARRIYGRTTFTEADAVGVRDYARAPINRDAIAVTDFPLDSLACTTERVPGCTADGQFFLQELSRPGQIPYGVLLPERIDNLLAAGAASVTHVAWGTVRQTATFMHVCESAAIAAAHARETGASVGTISIDRLQRRLVESGIMISFFNDLDMGTEDTWTAAVQYFGSRGFFSSYDANADQPLDRRVAEYWLAGVSGRIDPRESATAVHAVERLEGEVQPISVDEFVEAARRHGVDLADSNPASTGGGRLSRGEACCLLYRSVEGGPAFKKKEGVRE